MGDLGRYERMAQRARARREQAERAQLRQELAEQVDRVRAELRRDVDNYLAGPPDGCTECYWLERHSQYGSTYPGAIWMWVHQPPPEDLWHAVRAGDEPEEVLTCRHFCHGPDGYPRPIILIA